MTDEAEENNQKDSKSTIGEKFKRVLLQSKQFFLRKVNIFRKIKGMYFL